MSKNSNASYNSSNIKVLKGLEAVRKRPGMYIGDTDDGTGLHHMVFEVSDNAVDEALAGYCTRIEVTIHTDGSVSVRDNGRGIPVDIHSEENRSAAEVIMTVLHAGGKFDDNTYKVSGGLHGVGISVVNALSEKLYLTIFRDGKRYEQTYFDGIPQNVLSITGESETTGTLIRFYPNKEIFVNNNIFDYEILLKRFRELAFLNAGLVFVLYDQKHDKKEMLEYSGGLYAFVEYLNHNKKYINKKPFYVKDSIYVKVSKQNVQVEIALQWQDSFKEENILYFTNTIPQPDYGKHTEGLRAGLTQALNHYLEREGLTKKLKLKMTGEDFREGLIGVVSVKLHDPKFSSQTKEKLVSSEVKGVVQAIILKHFEAFLLENPSDAKAIAIKAMQAAKTRCAAAQAKTIARKDALHKIADLPGKLADCQERNPALSELFIVEGKSAGGNAKQARNRRYQAILPMRGKILNVERAGFDRMLSSEEVGSLIIALGCGIGKEFDIKKLRYHRIIIMTDADVDGSHIRTLLLTFFYRHMPELIQQGYIYIAQPPLYKLKKGKQEHYLKNEESLEMWLAKTALEDVNLYDKEHTIPVLKNAALEELITAYRQIRSRLKFWERRYPAICLQTLLEISLLSIKQLHSQAAVKEFCEAWQMRLDHHMSKDKSARYLVNYVEQALPMDDGVQSFVYMPSLQEWRFGVETTYLLAMTFFQHDDYQMIQAMTSKLVGLVKTGYIVKQGNQQKTIESFKEMYDWLMDEASRSYSIQRYKGLGEMNADQLEQVLKPDMRSLSQVTVDDAIAADQLLVVLMGDIVEPRREFIEQNALDVTNIDT